MGSAWRRGAIISTDSAPRTQRGTITGSPRTLSRPSFFISASVQSMARSSDSEPENRGPKVSVMTARRFQAALSFSARAAICVAASR